MKNKEVDYKFRKQETKEEYNKKFMNEYQNLMELTEKEIENEEQQKLKEKEIELNQYYNEKILSELNEKTLLLEKGKLKYMQDVKCSLKQETENLKIQYQYQQNVLFIIYSNN